MESRTIRPVVGAVFAFSDARKAYEHVMTGHARGRVMLDMVRSRPTKGGTAILRAGTMIGTFARRRRLVLVGNVKLEGREAAFLNQDGCQ